MSEKRGDSRGKVAAFANEDGNVNLVVGCYLAEFLRQVIVLELGEGVQLLVIVDGEDRDATTVFDVDDIRVGGGHDVVFFVGDSSYVLRLWYRQDKKL